MIGESVTVEAVLPSEDTAISVDSLLIMDIIVRLEDGSLANVEIQKIPYQFAAERISCYSSDLLLREYTRLKQNKNFLYSDMKKVYTIVLYEKSSAVFKDASLNGAYLHHGKTRFDSGLNLEMLQEYFMIALDVFCENGYTEDTDLTGWLSVLTAETMADVERVIRHYPWSKAIFYEMSEYVRNPKEVLLMFSEALKIADKNTVKYMMEELQDKVSELEEEQKQAEETIQRQESEIARLRAQLAQKEKSNV